jgi:hypothetical protein
MLGGREAADAKEFAERFTVGCIAIHRGLQGAVDVHPRDSCRAGAAIADPPDAGSIERNGERVAGAAGYRRLPAMKAEVGIVISLPGQRFVADGLVHFVDGVGISA